MALILFDTVIKNLDLETYHLSTVKEIEKYNYFLQLFPKNTLYTYTLLTFGKSATDKLMYFVFTHHGKPLALMPFILRKILLDKKETGFNDVCSPYGYSGPIFTKNTNKYVIGQFWRQVDKWYKKNNVVTEFVRFNMQENWRDYNGEIYPTLANVCGKVLAEEEQWDNFKPKVRNNYRKSVKWKLKSIIYHKNISADIIKQFHRLYVHTMERKQALPQNLDYFLDLIENNPSICAIIIIYKDNLPISTELLILSNTTINSFLGGTDSNYFHTRPNDYLKTEVLKWAWENGYSYYFLGGGRENNDSLYRYKKEFFPLDEDSIFYTGRKIVNKEVYDILVGNNPNCIGCTLKIFFPLYRCQQDC